MYKITILIIIHDNNIIFVNLYIIKAIMGIYFTENRLNMKNLT